MIRPQVHARTVSLLLGLQTFHPAQFCPSWGKQGLGLLDWREQYKAMSDPALREKLISEMEALDNDPVILGFMNPHSIFQLGDPPNYEPDPSESVGARCERAGISRWAGIYDALMNDGGRELLNSPVLNYSDGNLDAVHEMLTHPASAFGLGDGGAHAGQTCDASTTTFLLSHWARDRQGDRLSVETAVHKMTGATAALYGLGDRGRLDAGCVADVNLIDFDSLQLHRPELVSDLPGGASRLIQKSEGYVSTIKSGVEIMADGEPTGERPGRLLRGAR
jgi:N-acyl-D-aspartate/D-glutamate deacylase